MIIKSLADEFAAFAKPAAISIGLATTVAIAAGDDMTRAWAAGAVLGAGYYLQTKSRQIENRIVRAERTPRRNDIA